MLFFCGVFSLLLLPIICFIDFCSLFSLLGTLGLIHSFFSSSLKWKCTLLSFYCYVFKFTNLFCPVSKLLLIPSNDFFSFYMFFLIPRSFICFFLNIFFSLFICSFEFLSILNVSCFKSPSQLISLFLSFLWLFLLADAFPDYGSHISASS